MEPEACAVVLSEEELCVTDSTVPVIVWVEVKKTVVSWSLPVELISLLPDEVAAVVASDVKGRVAVSASPVLKSLDSGVPGEEV